MRTLGAPDTATTCSTKTYTQFIIWPKWINVVDRSCRNRIDVKQKKIKNNNFYIDNNR